MSKETFINANYVEKGGVAELYNYKDTEGNIVCQKVYYSVDDFDVKYLENGEWVDNEQDMPLMLYNLPKVVRNEEIFVVNDEKSVNNLVQNGIIATAPSLGFKNWDESFNQYFANKRVYIIHDNNSESEVNVKKIIEDLIRITPYIKILNLKLAYHELKNNENISDMFEKLGKEKTKSLLLKLVNDEPWETITMYPKWQAVKPFDDFELGKFPVQALPKCMKDYIETISNNLAIPLEMAALSELGVISTCLQGKVEIAAKDDYKESINLYTLIIAEPGERKSSLLKILTKPIEQYEKSENKRRKTLIKEINKAIKAKEEELSKFDMDFERKELIAREIEELENSKPKLIRLTTDDFTVEALTSLMVENDGRMSVISSEGTMFNNITGRYSNKGSFESLLKAYTGDTIRVDRKSREPEFIENALLTIVIMAQESILDGIMDNNDLRGQGFLGRFLYCKPKSPIGTRQYDTPALNHDIIDNFEDMIFKFLDSKDSVILTFSKEAHNVCREFFDWIEPRLLDEFLNIRDWASKIHGTTIRIAGILHMVENKGVGDKIISKKTMENAVTLAKYFINHAQLAYSVMGTSAAVIKAKAVLQKLYTVDGLEITRRDLFRNNRGKYFKVTEDIDEPLKLLEEHGYIRIKERSSDTVGRKPSTVIELNPLHFGHNVQNAQ